MRIGLFDQIMRPIPSPDAAARDRLMNGLKNSGHEVILFKGCNFADLPFKTRFRCPEVYWSAKNILDFHKSHPLDVIHIVNTDGREMAGYLSTMLPEVPIVISFRGPGADSSLEIFSYSWKRLLKKIILAVPSFELKDRIHHRVGDEVKIEVVPNSVLQPISLTWSRSKSCHFLGIHPHGNYWIIPGAIRREDRIIELLRVLNSWNDLPPIVIAGTAVDKDRMERLRTFVESKNQKSKIILTGTLTPEGIINLCAHAQLCLFPPGGEGGRSSLLQAAIVGTPVVSDYSPTHSQLENLSWVSLVKTNNTIDFAKEVVHFHDRVIKGKNYDLLHKTSSLFTLKTEIHHYLRLYKLKTSVKKEHGLRKKRDRPSELRNFPNSIRLPLKIQSCLVIANGTGEISLDLNWSQFIVDFFEENGCCLKMILGSQLTNEFNLNNILSSSKNIFCVPNAWLRNCTLPAVVLAEELIRRNNPDVIIAYGIQRADMISSVLAAKFGLPCILVLDEIDEINLISSFNSGDIYSISRSTIVITKRFIFEELRRMFQLVKRKNKYVFSKSSKFSNSQLKFLDSIPFYQASNVLSQKMNTIYKAQTGPSRNRPTE